MATTDDVRRLAALARIQVDEAELPKFTKEFDAILSYVSQLEKLDLGTGTEPEVPPLHNVMREDGEPRESGTYTEKLAEQFPAREQDALVVKQVISYE